MKREKGVKTGRKIGKLLKAMNLDSHKEKTVVAIPSSNFGGVVHF